MKKRVLNVHVSIEEAAHVEAMAKREALSLTMALRMLIREDMKRAKRGARRWVR